MRKVLACFLPVSLLLFAPGCDDGGSADDANRNTDSGSDPDPGEDGSATGDGDGDGDGGSSSSGGTGTDSPLPGGPDADGIPQFGEPGFDPSVDPGIDSIFLTNPIFTQDDVYAYVPTAAGDHELDEGIVAIDYDVTGDDDLATTLATHLEALQGGHGLALYLLNGTALSDEDLLFLQMLNTEDNGLGLTNLDTLHVYNLQTLQGGVESTTETVYGNPYPNVWYNGWQGPNSEVAKGDGGWVKHLVMDDLLEIQAGTFCDTMFETVSFKGVKTIREMGFGFRPRAKLETFYFPSVELIETHAFRRNQYLLNVHLPRVKTIEEFAFDDVSRLQYFSAPSLEWIGRNGLNDTHDLTAVHLPSLQYVGINCFDLQYKLTTLRLPEVTEIRDNGLEGFEVLKFAYLPKVEDLNSRTMINCFELEAVYLGEVPPAHGTDVFTNTSENLTIYHSGDNAEWSDWTPAGNESAEVIGL